MTGCAPHTAARAAASRSLPAGACTRQRACRSRWPWPTLHQPPRLRCRGSPARRPPRLPHLPRARRTRPPRSPALSSPGVGPYRSDRAHFRAPPPPHASTHCPPPARGARRLCPAWARAERLSWPSESPHPTVRGGSPPSPPRSRHHRRRRPPRTAAPLPPAAAAVRVWPSTACQPAGCRHRAAAPEALPPHLPMPPPCLQSVALPAPHAARPLGRLRPYSGRAWPRAVKACPPARGRDPVRAAHAAPARAVPSSRQLHPHPRRYRSRCQHRCRRRLAARAQLSLRCDEPPRRNSRRRSRRRAERRCAHRLHRRRCSRRAWYARSPHPRAMRPPSPASRACRPPCRTPPPRPLH
eukprot:7378698-Prymnesium_polylepis.1